MNLYPLSKELFEEAIGLLVAKYEGDDRARDVASLIEELAEEGLIDQ